MKKPQLSFVPGLLPALFALTQVFCACAGQVQGRPAAGNPLVAAGIPAAAVPAAESAAETLVQADIERISGLLDEMAELERSGIYRREMALAESGLREKIGDYAGAVVAIFKDMSWAYGHGYLTKEDIDQGLHRVLVLEGQEGKEAAVQAAHALIAFMQERWDDAGQKLAALFGGIDEPDSFVNWMILSCTLEKENGDRKAGSVYRAIRARYVQFPEYWYRGAKVFSGSIASEYAEICISLAPNGPFAGECRSILASFTGLRQEDGVKIRTKSEIESIISQAVNTGNPYLLEPLIPLFELAENPYTIYALGALKSLAFLPSFRAYFDCLAADSKGRLADRFTYISRG